MRRTLSENQLSEDEAMAEYKDFMFYSRIVNGIARQNSERSSTQDSSLLYENELCLGNIVRTRHYNVEDMMKQKQHQQQQYPLKQLPTQHHHHHYPQDHHHYYGATTASEWSQHLMPPYNYQPYHQPVQNDESDDHAEMFVLDM
jgi:hypothetical protein